MADFFYNTAVGIVILTFLQALALLVPLLIGVAYLTLAERKVLAAIQIRKGPNVVGPFGLLQPFADALKMLMKETIIPSGANRILFLLAPMLTFMLAMLAVEKFAFIHPSPAARTFGDVSYVFVLPTGFIGAVLLLKGWLSKPA